MLETPDTSKYLGVSITDNLTLSRHTAITTGKANRVLGFLRRNINDCSTKVKAIKEHASAALDPHLQKDISQLERVERRAARFCCGDYTNRTPGCAEDITLGKPGNEEEEQPPKSPSQNQNRSC